MRRRFVKCFLRKISNRIIAATKVSFLTDYFSSNGMECDRVLKKRIMGMESCD